MANRETLPARNRTQARAKGNRIRAALMLRGLHFARWAKLKGYSHSTVWTAAYQLRGGKLARKIHAELEQLIDA